MNHLKKLSLNLEAAGGPFHDPALLVTPTNQSESLLFDCGTLETLKTRELLKVKWLFLTHLHIDHLIGFDHLLRVRLFSALPLIVFGPPGTVETISHRLQGYTWNLTSGSPFQVQVTDLPLSPGESTVSLVFLCQERFLSDEAVQSSAWVKAKTVELNEAMRVHWHPVKHGVPCYCYRLDRTIPPKFSLENCLRLGLKPGPWVRDLTDDKEVTQIVEAQVRDRAWLAAQLLSAQATQKLGYLTDTELDDELTEELSHFFQGVDVLVSETAYLESESALAQQNLHMTTTQVANLALRSKAERLLLFHLSRRHMEAGPEQHLREVRTLFPSADLLHP